MPHHPGYWYDVCCTWCGSTLRVRGPRPVEPADPPSRDTLGPCPACHWPSPHARWVVPTFDRRIDTLEQLQILWDQTPEVVDIAQPDPSQHPRSLVEQEQP